MENHVTLKTVLIRDWPGLVASAVTFGLFIMAVYLVIITQVTVVGLKAENAAIITSVAEVKSQLRSLHIQLERLQEKQNERE